MPSPPDYLKGFDIHKGMKIDGYVLIKIHIEHIELKKYRRYAYPVELVFALTDENKGDVEKFEKDLRSHVSGKRRILSKYGNPYSCTFGEMHFTVKNNGEKISVLSAGHGVRVF